VIWKWLHCARANLAVAKFGGGGGGGGGGYPKVLSSNLKMHCRATQKLSVLES